MIKIKKAGKLKEVFEIWEKKINENMMKERDKIKHEKALIELEEKIENKEVKDVETNMESN